MASIVSNNFVSRNLRFTLVDIGTLGGKTSSALAISESGNVVGRADLSSQKSHGFLYSKGRLLDLGTNGRNASVARSINQDGSIVGYLLKHGHAGPSEGFVYRAGKIETLRPLGSRDITEATGINRAGDVAGTSGNEMGLSTAVIWSDYGRNIRAIGILPGGTRSVAEDINDAGDVVGVSDASKSPSLAFLCCSGMMRDLGTLGGSTSYAYALNNHRQVVGESNNHYDRRRAFLWDSGKLVDLGVLADDRPDAESVAHGINDVGWIVGSSGKLFSFPDPDVCRATLWIGRKPHDLNALISPGSGWRLTAANAVNSRNEIAGAGVLDG